ncbi:hypothetical protein OROMI_028146 [Orobanche minor]
MMCCLFDFLFHAQQIESTGLRRGSANGENKLSIGREESWRPQVGKENAILPMVVKAAVAKKTISKEKQQKKRSRQKRLKAYDLSSISEYLPELKSSSESKPADFKINSKTRNKLLLKEGNQLKTVINHPVFQSDPLGAIYQHLQNTQPPADEKPKIKDNKTRKNKTRKKKSKGMQSMEM